MSCNRLDHSLSSKFEEVEERGRRKVRVLSLARRGKLKE